MHELGLVGGTFDHFHDGHALLIREMLERCNRIEVWLASDNRAQSKDPRILSWELRRSQLLDRFADRRSNRITISTLENDFGPAPSHDSAGAIACTKETKVNCENINHLRVQNHLDPLEVIEIPHVMAWDNNPISSTRIRRGEIDRSGRPWIPDFCHSSEVSMTPEAEKELKQPFGELIEGPEEDPSVAIRGVFESIMPVFGPIIAVGDVTVRAIQDFGRTADVALIDGQTQRSPWDGSKEINHDSFDFVIRSISPAGILTPSLLHSCEKSIQSWLSEKSRTLIIVDGEEDLAPLLLHPLSPLGSVVLYGQPNEGVVVRFCSEESKLRCRNLLSLFEKTSA